MSPQDELPHLLPIYRGRRAGQAMDQFVAFLDQRVPPSFQAMLPSGLDPPGVAEFFQGCPDRLDIDLPQQLPEVLNLPLARHILRDTLSRLDRTQHRLGQGDFRQLGLRQFDQLPPQLEARLGLTFQLGLAGGGVAITGIE